MYEMLILDEGAIGALTNARITPTWFENFDLPSGGHGLKRVAIGGLLYLLSTKANESSRLLFVNLATAPKLQALPEPVRAFERTLHVALSNFASGVNIPMSWHAYHEGALISVYASGHGEGARLYFDQGVGGTRNVYAYARTEFSAPIREVGQNQALYRGAYEHYADALLADDKGRPADEPSIGIVLSEPRGKFLMQGHTLEEWYERKLTPEQRRFVDRDPHYAVRLKGAAGTGKTVAMAVKCLKDFYSHHGKTGNARFLFVTHSTASSHDVVLPMLEGLDPSLRWQQIASSTINVLSLYELAQQLMQWEGKGLRPLSLDGAEGREFQRLFIDDAIQQCLRDTWFKTTLLTRCSEKLRRLLEDPSSRETALNELSNEFANVLEAERVRKGYQSGADYLRASRESWQMPLPLEADRAVVLDVHDHYCKLLERESVLSIDQMISDLNVYLLSHEWTLLREKLGYDAVFVDELHYFNRAERMILHNLFRKERERIAAGHVPLFMAYDLKQAPTDAFLGTVASGGAANWFRSLGVGATQLDELTQVFRYTSEIAEFLKDLDSAFPALDLEGEWGALNAVSETSGPKPELHKFRTNIELLDWAFREAGAEAAKLGGRHVAVLCINEQLFAGYLKAGRIAGKFVPIVGRDTMDELRYAGKRCVFSVPDFVAGLQFEVVFLIHLDHVELAEDPENIGIRRRLLSRSYLGASRAQTRLRIGVSDERGGPSSILNVPIARSSIVGAR